MKDSAVRNPSAAHRPHQKRKRVRRRCIFRAVARCALSVTEAGPLFPDSFFGVDTPLSSSPRGLLSLGESPRGELHKGRFQLQGKTRNVQGGHDGKSGNGSHHSDEGDGRGSTEFLAPACGSGGEKTCLRAICLLLDAEALSAL